jgi:hypothetical protein
MNAHTRTSAILQEADFDQSGNATTSRIAGSTVPAMKTVDLGQGAVPVAVTLDLLFSLRQSLSLVVCAATWLD